MATTKGECYLLKSELLGFAAKEGDADEGEVRVRRFTRVAIRAILEIPEGGGEFVDDAISGAGVGIGMDGMGRMGRMDEGTGGVSAVEVEGELGELGEVGHGGGEG